MIRRSLLFASFVLLVAFSSSACGLVFGGTRQMIRVESTPVGASVATDPSTTTYATPASFSLQRNRSYAMTVSAPGYTSRTIDIQRSIRAGIVVLDIVFGLVPVVVDAATGAWYSLSPEYNTVVLERLAAEGPGPEQVIVAVRHEAGRGDAAFDVRALDPRVEVSVALRPID
ncbi:MAG: hypothetical protein ABS36_14325 [Acidobacteria bacterium SCN 69-37]|nr:MAG: hypothetical protein ABS36_14325 [Acidobacteria bacterium SCN 69-37]